MKRRLKRLRVKARKITKRIAKRRRRKRPAGELKKALVRVNGHITELAAKLARRRIDWNGCPPLASRRMRKIVRLVLAETDCYVTATTNGSHAPTSWHYHGRAVDFGSSDPQNRPEREAQDLLYRHLGSGFFLELFGPVDFYVKNGRRYSGQFPSHEDHDHAAA